jgi:hypothetical protein
VKTRKQAQGHSNDATKKEPVAMPEPSITTNEPPTTKEGQPPTSSDTDALRAQALKQVERVHAFKLHVVASTIGMLLLTCIWAISEYHNAGGWPSNGFSQSSSIPHVWNDWIIWPLIAWLSFLCLRAYTVYFRRPPSEAEIEREMTRLGHAR